LIVNVFATLKQHWINYYFEINITFEINSSLKTYPEAIRKTANRWPRWCLSH